MTRSVAWIVAAASMLAGAAPLSAQTAPAGGTIALQPQAADGTSPALVGWLMDAVSRTLNAKGFTILADPDHVGYVAQVAMSRDAVGTAMEKDKRDSIGQAGVGVYVPLRSGGSSAVAMQRTKLEISIRRRGGDVVWHGTALTVRPAGSDGATASALSRALLSGYPEQPEDVVGVP